MNRPSLTVVFASAPYSDSNGQEALDAALIGAAFEQQVSLLFLHDGVFQLKINQQTVDPIKQTTKAFSAVADFGVDHVYVHDLALLARGLELDDLSLDVETLDSAAITLLLSQQDRVLTF